MAELARLLNWKGAGLSLDSQALMRLSIWGVAALGALAFAILAAHSNTVAEREVVASAGSESSSSGSMPGSSPWPAGASLVAELAARSSDLENETRRLSGSVKELIADRDRLATRIATLERNLEDVTGAIKRQAAAPAPTPAPPTLPSSTSSTTSSSPAEPPTVAAAPAKPVAASPAPAPGVPPPTASAAAATTPTPAAPTAAAPAAPITPASAPAAPSPVPPVTTTLFTPAPLALRDQVTPNVDGPAPSTPASDQTGAARRAANENAMAAAGQPDSEATKPKAEIGVDVGGANSFDSLRGLWQATKTLEPTLFEGLHPLVVARETKTRSTDLRLIVGPLANLDAATRLCVALSTERRYCQPTVFEGQELALNVPSREPERRPAASSTRKPAPTSQRQQSAARPRS